MFESSTPAEWERLEESAAQKLGGRRVQRRVEFFEPAPDIVVDDFPEMAFDAKLCARFSHHRLIEVVRAKYCGPNEVPVLITKSHADEQQGEFVTLPLDAFASLLNEVRHARQQQED